MAQVCRCGRDSIATCRSCGTRVCGSCYIGDPRYVSDWFDKRFDKSKGWRVTAKSFAPMPLSITSTREGYTAEAAFNRDRDIIICGICRFSAAAETVSSLHEIPVPHEFGSLSEAASDIIEGRWTPRADHKRPATAQEIDDAIRWHMNNRTAEDVRDSWRDKRYGDVDVKYRKGWTIGSTPDRCRRETFEDGVITRCSVVIVDQHRQFHLCDSSGEPASGGGPAFRENMCETESRGRWFDRRTYSHWRPQLPTLLLGDIARTIVNGHSGFGFEWVSSSLVPYALGYYPPLPL